MRSFLTRRGFLGGAAKVGVLGAPFCVPASGEARSLGPAPIWTHHRTASIASVGDRLYCDTAGGAWTLMLPADALERSTVCVADPVGSWSTHNLIIGGNGRPFLDGMADLVCDVDFAELHLVVRDGRWRF